MAMATDSNSITNTPIKNGVITTYFKSGQKEQEENWVDGKREGLDTDWYENGLKSYERTYKNGKLEGLYTKWHENGQKSFEGTYKNDELEGFATDWYENGQKSCERTFKNDNLDGLFTDWYENGRKSSESTYKNGNLEGLAIGWYENGQKSYEETYENDNGVGLFTKWYESGQKRSEGACKNGKLEGLFTGWYANGQKREESTYKNDKLDGLSTEWYENGCVHIKRKPKGYWTLERCMESASEFDTLKEWRESVSSAYVKACKNGWIVDCWPDENRTDKKSSGYWTLERCTESAKTFKNRTEWSKGEAGAHDAAYRNDWLDTLFPTSDYFGNGRRRITLKQCIESVEKFNSISEWREADPSAYSTAASYGWIGVINMNRNYVFLRFWLSNIDPELSKSAAEKQIMDSDIYKQSKYQPGLITLAGYVGEWKKI